MFLHGGWAHLGGNMLFLWIFGDNIERRLGHARFLAFYLACGLAAGIAHILFNSDSGVPTVGASGAISGVLGGYLLLFPHNRVRVMTQGGITAVPGRIVMLGLWILMQFISGSSASIADTGETGGVAYLAHIGGFVAGLALVTAHGRTPAAARPRVRAAAPAPVHERRPNRTSRYILIGLVLLSLGLLALVIFPFASALLFAAVLAGAFHPWLERLSARWGGRRQTAAVVLSAGVALLLVLPVAALTVSVGRQVVDGVGYVRDTLRTGGLPALVAKVPAPLRPAAERALGHLMPEGQGQAQIEELAAAQTGRATAAVGGIIKTTSNILLQVALMLVAFFLLLVDGPKLVDWLGEVVPLQARADPRDPARLPQHVRGRAGLVDRHRGRADARRGHRLPAVRRAAARLLRRRHVRGGLHPGGRAPPPSRCCAPSCCS